MKDRIKQLRKHFYLSQSDFGKQLGVSRDVINNIEQGRVEPKPLFINHLCSTFNVDPHWLDTGEGDMFVPQSSNEELVMIFGKALSEDADPRRMKLLKSIINIVNNIPDEALPIVCDYARQIADSLEEE